MFTSQ